jgi:predicted dinucleotide-binding enzyme
MKITLAGSLGNISKPLAEMLITNSHDVTIISSDSKKASDYNLVTRKHLQE